MRKTAKQSHTWRCGYKISSSITQGLLFALPWSSLIMTMIGPIPYLTLCAICLAWENARPMSPKKI